MQVWCGFLELGGDEDNDLDENDDDDDKDGDVVNADGDDTTWLSTFNKNHHVYCQSKQDQRRLVSCPHSLRADCSRWLCIHILALRFFLQFCYISLHRYRHLAPYPIYVMPSWGRAVSRVETTSGDERKRSKSATGVLLLPLDEANWPTGPVQTF